MQGKRATFDETKFDTITPSSAYWIGFLYADGCIYHNTIVLTLHEKDIEHLNKFNRFLEGNINIRYVKTMKAYTFAFNSLYMINKLKSYNITSNKTFTCIPSDTLKNNKDFWRGVIDGDGHISISSGIGIDKRIRPRIELCGNLQTIECYRNFVHTNICKFENKIGVHSSIFRIQTSGEKAFNISQYVYKNSEIFLDRKKDISDKINEIFANKFREHKDGFLTN